MTTMEYWIHSTTQAADCCRDEQSAAGCTSAPCLSITLVPLLFLVKIFVKVRDFSSRFLLSIYRLLRIRIKD